MLNEILDYLDNIRMVEILQYFDFLKQREEKFLISNAFHLTNPCNPAVALEYLSYYCISSRYYF